MLISAISRKMLVEALHEEGINQPILSSMPPGDGVRDEEVGVTSDVTGVAERHRRRLAR